jgi:hypothetical protein
VSLDSHFKLFSVIDVLKSYFDYLANWLDLAFLLCSASTAAHTEEIEDIAISTRLSAFSQSLFTILIISLSLLGV